MLRAQIARWRPTLNGGPLSGVSHEQRNVRKVVECGRWNVQIDMRYSAMTAAIKLARFSAPFFAAICAFGILFFGDFYLAPENRRDLVIYGLPVPALLIGAITPRKWLKNITLSATVVFMAIAAIIAMAIAIYRDMNLINGADLPAVVIRLVIISILVLLSCSAILQRKAI